MAVASDVRADSDRTRSNHAGRVRRAPRRTPVSGVRTTRPAVRRAIRRAPSRSSGQARPQGDRDTSASPRMRRDGCGGSADAVRGRSSRCERSSGTATSRGLHLADATASILRRTGGPGPAHAISRAGGGSGAEKGGVWSQAADSGATRAPAAVPPNGGSKRAAATTVPLTRLSNSTRMKR